MTEPEQNGDQRVEETLSVFAASVGHDFQTIFAAVSSTLDILARSSRLESSDRNRIQKSKLMVHRGSEVAQLLSSFLRQHRENSEHEVNVSAAVQEAIVLCETHQDKVEVILDDTVLKSPHIVKFGAAAFRLALVLAIKNALDYADGKPVTVQVAAQGGFVYIYVRDQGRGFSQEEMNELLEGKKLARDSDRALGLQSVAELLREAGGEIYLESGPGAGTVVTFAFPLLREDTPGKPLVDPLAKPPSLIPNIKEVGYSTGSVPVVATTPVVEENFRTRKKNEEPQVKKDIYILDRDDVSAGNLKSVIWQIRGDAARVHTFSTGEAMLEHFEKAEEYPAWIFVDYFLTGIRGDEVIRALLGDLYSSEGVERFGLTLMSGLPSASILQLKKDIPSLVILKKPLMFDHIQALFNRNTEVFNRIWDTQKLSMEKKDDTGSIKIVEDDPTPPPPAP